MAGESLTVPLDDFGADRTDTQATVAAFREREPTPHAHSVVYGIYDRQTGECLYVGEAKWLVSRLNDHYNTRSGSQIKAFVEADDTVSIDASNVWERTAVKFVAGIDGGAEGRRSVESILIDQLDPRYNSE